MALGKKKKSKAKKKTTTRKASVKKTAKKTVKKSARKKPAAKKTVRKAAKKSVKKKSAPRKRAVSAEASDLRKDIPEILPGPPIVEVPPVEEPARHEQAIGVVTHYYSHLGVAVVQLNTGKLRTGDTIRVKGHTTDFTQAVESIEYEHRHVDEAVAGQAVGLKIIDHAREHDIVYLE